LRRALAILLLSLAPLAVGCGGSGGGSGKSTKQKSLAGQRRQHGSDCKRVRAPHAKSAAHEKKPKRALDASRKWSLVISTNCGSFTVALDVSDAPHTAASLVALARSGFFNGTVFHRIVPGFVIQGGDPTATGQGGPGYSTVDKPPPAARYTRGVVAMAKTQTQPPGTAGSQFFVVTGSDAGLPPEYAVVGRVVEGIDVVERIGQLGDPSTERPTQPVVISRVNVRRG